MGMFDSVMVKCPNCGIETEFQSKSGECLGYVYDLRYCPDDVMINVNRHSPYKCQCGTLFEVDIENRKPVALGQNNEENVPKLQTYFPIEFIVWLTGHDKEIVLQMFNDWQNSIYRS